MGNMSRPYSESWSGHHGIESRDEYTQHRTIAIRNSFKVMKRVVQSNMSAVPVNLEEWCDLSVQFALVLDIGGFLRVEVAKSSYAPRFLDCKLPDAVLKFLGQATEARGFRSVARPGRSHIPRLL